MDAAARLRVSYFVPHPQLLMYSHNPTCCILSFPIVLPFCDSVLNYLHSTNFILEEVQPIMLATFAILVVTCLSWCSKLD